MTRALHRTSSALALLAAGVLGSVAAAPAPAFAAPGPFTARYGTATASGTSSIQPGSGLFGDLVVRGTLSNSGSGCTSAWMEVVRDLAPGPWERVASQCSGQSAPIDHRTSWSPTYNAQIMVCRGTTDTSVCGAAVRLN
ncbi:MAG TPA: hypothetical protein VGD11_10475 [Mycobacteriales bacterium]|jgi:hypothetical protein